MFAGIFWWSYHFGTGTKKYLLEIKGSLLIKRDEPDLSKNISLATWHLYTTFLPESKNPLPLYKISSVEFCIKYFTKALQENRILRPLPKDLIVFKQKRLIQQYAEAAHRMCSTRKGVLRNFAKFTGKHFVGLRAITLFKKRLWRRCFPVNFVKFLRLYNFAYKIHSFYPRILEYCFGYIINI